MHSQIPKADQDHKRERTCVLWFFVFLLSFCLFFTLSVQICLHLVYIYLVAQLVKNQPPAIWGTWVWSLGHEDPLEKEMATHSSIPAYTTPWTEEPSRLQLQRVGHEWETFTFMCVNIYIYIYMIYHVYIYKHFFKIYL